ncbi:MAG: S8 family serine peptidase [Anaerolineae bacterium]|nr:S8 family serine peptidase [Anaerolineae bacterium]
MKTKKHLKSRFITAVGLGILVEVLIVAVLFTASIHTSQSANNPLPTLNVLPTINVALIASPTAPPSIDDLVIAPLAVTSDTRLANPVPNQFILRFPRTLSQAERDTYIASLRGQVIQEIGSFGDVDAVSVWLPAGVTATSETLAATEPDYYVQWALDTNPNDHYFADQWGVRAVNALNAWAGLSADTPIIRVAVIDSGVYDGHPDLAGHVEPGWDYVENDAVPQDDFGHGTGVAGILAALSNNQMGIVGLAPHVRILPLRVLDSQGIGTYSDVAAAILRAVDSGAHIINLSLGGYNTSSLLQDAIDYAVQRGVQVVAAAGNTGNETVLYPAAYGPVVAVGAVNDQLEISVFSSHNNSAIDLYAPGEGIWTTTEDGGYASSNGTSFAAPYVSGIAALEMAYSRTLIQNGKVVAFGGANAPPPPPSAGTPRPSTTEISDAVIAAINADGQAKVIINLFDPVSGQAVFEPDAERVSALQDGVLQALSAEDFAVVHRYRRLPALAGNLNASGLAVLQSQPFAVSVHLDTRTFAHTAEARDILEVDHVFTQHGLTGAGVRVAVLDTGVDHPDLVSSIVAQQCFTDGDCDILQPGDTVNQSSSARDHDGHGTHVTGIITAAGGIAPDSEIIAVRVLGNDGSGWTSDWIAGLDWIIQNQAALQVDIINMSLGSSDLIVGVCDGAFGAVFPAGVQAINQLTASGVAIFASSGNQGALNAIEAPACLSNVIAVGATYDANLGREPDTGTYDDGFPGGWPNCVDATTAPGMVTCFSNSSSKLAVLAPGAVIVSNGLGGGQAAYSGTSQASPIAAGVAALMLQADPTLIPDQIRSLMQEHGTSTLDTRTGQSFRFINAFATINTILADFCVGVTEIPRAECHALVDLYNSTNGSNWANNAGWLDTVTPCSWIGVGCEGGHVTSLVMLDNNMEGALPASVGSLGNLIRLHLAFNKLTGTLPTSVGNLTNLDMLHLAVNQLSGSLPAELFKLQNLTQLNLSQNRFNGDLPAEMSGLISLRILSLEVNQFTGTIPGSIGSLNQLEYLQLANNRFTGSIPAEFANLDQLKYLTLGINRLSGQIPIQLGNLQFLTILDLSSNQFSGPIPKEIGNLDSLANFQLQNNQLSGDIPTELGQLTNLRYFVLSNNQLSGPIPDSLCNLTNVYRFDLSGNQLSGIIPDCLTSFQNNIDLFTTSNNTDEIRRYDAETSGYRGPLVAAGTSPLDGGQELIVGWNGSILVSSDESSQILHYAPTDGTFYGVLVSAGSGGLKNPSGMVLRDQDLYVASTDTNEVLVYSAITGAFIESFTSCTLNFFTNSPTRLTFGPDGNLYVLHENAGNNASIVRYDGTTGVCLDEFNDFTISGEFFVADDMTFGPDGYLYVASNATDKDIVRFDVETGQSISRFVPDVLETVTNLTFGPDGNLYVGYGDGTLNGVNRYNGTTGAFIDAFIPPSTDAPNSPTDLLFRDLGLQFDISYNTLTATDPELRTFLDEHDPDWESTQTMPPTNVAAHPTSANGIQVSWQPAGDTVTDGYYEIFYRTGSSGDFKRAGQTSKKTETFFNLNGLNASTLYEFQIRTISLPQGLQKNRLESTFSASAGTITLASGCAGVTTIPVSECEALEAFYNSTNGAGWTQNTDWMQPGGNTFYVASGLWDNTIRLWDMNTGQSIGEPWSGHSGVVWSVGFSPNGTQVVSGSLDQTLRLWDAATGQPIGEPWTGHSGDVWGVAFSPDGTQVVSGSLDQTLRLWDATTGQPVGEPWSGHSGDVLSVSFSPNGTQVVSGSSDDTLRLWDAATGQPIGEPWTGHSGDVWGVAFSPDGTQVVSGSLDQTLRLWDATTGQPVGEPWSGHSDGIWSVAFSPDGTQVVSGSLDQTLRLWDVATGQPIGEPWIGHSSELWGVAFSPNGTRVVSSSSDDTLRLWDVATGQPVGEPWDSGTLVRGVAFSPLVISLPMNPCTWFGVICNGGHVTRLELPNNNLVGTLPPVLGNLTALEELDLSSNGLAGSIPTTFANLNSLLRLQLYNNQLNGTIPPELGDMDSIEMIWLSDNHLSGELPVGLSNAGDTVVFLGLDSNLLTGEIPDMWGSFTRLQALALAGNQFRGNPPASFATLSDTLSRAYLGHNALNIPPALTDPAPQPPQAPIDTAVLQLLETVDPTWLLSQTTPPTHVEITQVSPANGLPSAQSTHVGIHWKPPVFTEFLTGYEVHYSVQHPNGATTDGIIEINLIEDKQKQTSTVIDALSSGSEVTATVRSVTSPHEFTAPGNPPFPCILTTDRTPLTDLALPPGAVGNILVPEDGDCTVPTNPTSVLVSGTLTPELANYAIWVAVYTPLEISSKYYPQGRVDPICRNPRGVDIVGNTWSTDVFFGREGFTDEFHVVLVATEKGGTTDEIFKAWLVAGCESFQEDPDALCAYPGFPLVDLPDDPCTPQVFPGGVTEVDAIRVHSSVATTGSQQSEVVSGDSNQAVGEPPVEVEVDILNFEVEETITPGDDPLLPGGQPPSCGTNVSGKFRGSFPGGKFRGSFPGGTQVEFIVTSDELAPVVAVYTVDENGEIITEVKCVESNVVQPDNAVRISVPIDGDYVIYVWGNNGTGGTFVFQVLPLSPWEIGEIPYQTEAAIIIVEGEDDPNLPDVCQPTNARGKFRGSFPGGKFRGSFPGGQPSHFVITVFTHDIIPVIVVYETDEAGNILEDQEVKCHKGTDIGTTQLSVELEVDKNYLIVVISDSGLEGSFILTIEPVTVTIDRLPFTYEGFVDQSTDNLNMDCGESNTVGRFKAIFNSADFPGAFPNGIGRFRFLVSTTTFEPVIAMYRINPQGGVADTPDSCVTTEAIGSKEVIFTLQQDVDYLFTIRGDYGTTGNFDFWFEALDMATADQSPYIIKTNLNTSPYNLIPSCAPNSTGWFQVRLPKGSSIYQFPTEELQFGVETFSFVPVVALYAQNGDTLTEVACQTAEAAGLLKMIYTFDSTLDYTFIVRSSGGTGTDFEFGLATIPRLHTPTSYAYCPTEAHADTLAVTRLGNLNLNGGVVMEYATSPTERQLVPGQQYTVNHSGPSDYTLNVSYPLITEWPTFTLPQIEYPLSVIIVRMNFNVELTDGRLVDQLGPGQGWAVVCVHAPDPASQAAVLNMIWPNLWTALSSVGASQITPTLTPTPTLTEMATETPTETATLNPEVTETLMPPTETPTPSEVTAEPSPTETATLEASPTFEPPTATPQPTLEPPTAAPPPTVETTAETDPADTTP